MYQAAATLATDINTAAHDTPTMAPIYLSTAGGTQLLPVVEASDKHLVLFSYTTAKRL